MRGWASPFGYAQIECLLHLQAAGRACGAGVVVVFVVWLVLGPFGRSQLGVACVGGVGGGWHKTTVIVSNATDLALRCTDTTP